MSLATKKMAKKLKKEKQLREGLDAKDSDDEEFDLFSRDRTFTSVTALDTT